MKKILISVAILAALAIPAYGAGTCTQSTKTSFTGQARIPDAATVIVTISCTADASTGSVPDTAIALSGSSTKNPYDLFGYYLYQVGLTPGTTAPTANYSATVTDAEGFPLDLGLLASKGSASAAQLFVITDATTGYPTVRSAMTLAISGNSVASAQITVDLIFKAYK